MKKPVLVVMAAGMGSRYGRSEERFSRNAETDLSAVSRMPSSA